MDSAADMQKVVDCISNGTLAISLCRVCLKPLDEAAENAFTKICKEDHEYSVADILKSVCDIELSEVDDYQVCSNCFLLATTAYKFYLLTKQSDDILNFYVDELLRNVDSVIVPQHVVSESLCIPLPMVNPIEDYYNFNCEDLSKKLNIKKQIPTKTEEKTVNVQPKAENEKEQPKKPNTNLTNRVEKEEKIVEKKKDEESDVKIKKETQSDDDDNIVIIQDSDNNPRFFKILPDGSMTELDEDEAIEYQILFHNKLSTEKEPKKRKVRDKMAVLDCWMCSEKFKFTARLKKHLKEMHEIELLVCTVCREFFTDETDFNNHLSEHPSIYKCDICGFIFRQRYTLIRHIENHEIEKKSTRKAIHMCEVCGEVFKNSKLLKYHYNKKHIKRYTCYYCGKMYKSEYSFDSHLKKHEKSISEKDNKTQHPTIPQKPRTSEYMCAVCGRSCVDERALLWHTRLHTNERPFKCDECGRSFVSRNRRNQHAVTSHTAPSRRCPLCPALFHLTSMVNTHIKKVHLRTHKRRPRPSKHQNVYWRTEQVPVRDLSVSLQNQIIALQAKANDNPGVPGYGSYVMSGEEELQKASQLYSK